MRFFNTTGPVVPADHYCVPPLERLDLAELVRLLHNKRYFVLHAPRQSGKTTVLLAFRDLINAGGEYQCVYANFEAGQAMHEDVDAAMRAILYELASRAQEAGDGFLEEAWPAILGRAGAGNALGGCLSQWATNADKPLVVLIDEIDSLVGNTLLSVLRQLRSGYDRRPTAFPHSIVLCGLRDVRDYRIESGGSPFNIMATSLRLGDFSRRQVEALLAQHVEETGQDFAPAAVQRIWNRTRGQPWLVNALASEACRAGEADRDRSRAIREVDVEDAEERVILRRQTHLDQLADKLRQQRVRRVIEPILSGGDKQEFSARDLEYARDLGLVAQDVPLRIANPIYAEVVPRELTLAAQEGLTQDAAWYVTAAGALDMPKLLAAFQEFFREHSEHWSERFLYQEAWPQLLLQAFLQRVVNSGGRIEREYGLGRGRTDLLVLWRHAGVARKFVVECKLRRARDGLDAVVRKGAEQTAAYMDRCGAESGHLIVFDRSPDRSWEEKVFRRTERIGIATVTIWGM